MLRSVMIHVNLKTILIYSKPKKCSSLWWSLWHIESYYINNFRFTQYPKKGNEERTLVEFVIVDNGI